MFVASAAVPAIAGMALRQASAPAHAAMTGFAKLATGTVLSNTKGREIAVPRRPALVTAVTVRLYDALSTVYGELSARLHVWGVPGAAGSAV